MNCQNSGWFNTNMMNNIFLFYNTLLAAIIIHGITWIIYQIYKQYHCSVHSLFVVLYQTR